MVQNGVKLEIAETLHSGHATELARTAAGQGMRLVVAAGGDGTIAEVAAGLDGSDTPMGIIPLGTANVLAHELGLPFAPAAVAAALAFGRTRALWPGIASTAGVPRLFVQMIGAGFDAEVVHHLSLPLKRALGKTAYVLQGLCETIRYRFPQIAITIDGVATEAGSVIITKGRYYAGHYMLAPDASPMAPGFTVAMFDRTGPFAALAYGAALPLNMIHHMPGVRLQRAEEVTLGAYLTQTDGDPCGIGPTVVRNAATPIRVVVA
jgi:diacylglycerol kinase family enzyme